jgi:hypothetical protein
MRNELTDTLIQVESLWRADWTVRCVWWQQQFRFRPWRDVPV